MSKPLYQTLASLSDAIRNCEKSGNAEWKARHTHAINWLVRNYLPSGSGIDTGTHFYPDKQKLKSIRFSLSFHHMNDTGMYDGWTDHEVIVTASLSCGFELHVTGRDRNQIKEYLIAVYAAALSEQLDWHSIYSLNADSIEAA